MSLSSPLLPSDSSRTTVTSKDESLIAGTASSAVEGKRKLAKEIIDAAWPQAVVVACRNCISLTDLSVLGWLGKDELAAVAFAQIVLNLSGVVLWAGCGDALIALTSQAIGAENPHMAGIWLQTSFLGISLFAIPIGIFWWFTGDILSLIGSAGPSDTVCRLSAKFARYSLIWLIPDAIFSAFSQWLNGQQQVKPTIGINIFFVFFNLGANILLVHGVGGWGGLGFVGSPIATACTKILRGVATVVWICNVKRIHEKCWGGWTVESISRVRFCRFMTQAVPAALIGVVEQAQFVVITLFVGSLGTTDLDAHTGILNVFMFLTAGMYGLCDAGASTIGRYLGMGKPIVAKKTSAALLYCMMCMGALVAVFFLSTQTVIGHIFSTDDDVIRTTQKLATFCGACYFLLALTFACFGILQGQARPHIAALCMFLGLWGASVPLAYVFGFVWPDDGYGLLGVWTGLTVGYSSMTAFMVYFVYRSKWALLSREAEERSEKDRAVVAVERNEECGS